MPKMVNLGSVWKNHNVAFCQTVLPDRSILIRQKLVENAKIKKLQCDILCNVQTLWRTFSWGHINYEGISRLCPKGRLEIWLTLAFPINGKEDYRVSDNNHR